MRTIAVLLLLQGSALALYAWIERDRRPAPRIAAEPVEGAAPPLAFTRIDGSRGTLAELRGRPVLVHFWATWCVPCREEIPQLLSLAREMSREVAVLAIAVDDDWEAVRRFFSGPPPPEAVAEAEDDGPGRFGVTTLPDTYLVGANGDLRLRFHGPRDWTSDAMPAVLRAALTMSIAR